MEALVPAGRMAGAAQPSMMPFAAGRAEEPFRTIIEPFRIHSVEPMRLTTRAERASALAAAGTTCSNWPPRTCRSTC
jgi:hypothetical protein